MNKLRQCNEGYKLFISWYQSLTNGREALEKRRLLDEHLNTCPKCRKEKHDTDGTGRSSDKESD